jgi:hypothetical protein
MILRVSRNMRLNETTVRPARASRRWIERN